MCARGCGQGTEPIPPGFLLGAGMQRDGDGQREGDGQRGLGAAPGVTVPGSPRARVAGVGGGSGGVPAHGSAASLPEGFP